MTNEETLRQLTEMKLYTFSASFRDYLESTDHDELTFEERLSFMVDREWSDRNERRLNRRLKSGKLREEASVEDINYQHPRGLDKSVMQRLIACKWVKNAENIIFTGKTGVGKTWLACALANKACRNGATIKYDRIPRLLEELYVAHADGSYPQVMNKLAKIDVLILDDFGLAPLSDTERRDLLEVLEDRQKRKSTIFTSQIDLKHWHEIIGEPTVADAILDRLVTNSHKIKLGGKSLRGKK
ncbi:MAG: IS21-like element helper ATPase IstB [Deltaproteobacteria bacterium]|nr:IS21-like element helper ATPase IstB [Deltaproteobacteria bacterium]